MPEGVTVSAWGRGEAGPGREALRPQPGAVTLRLRPENGKRSLGDLESCSRTRGSTDRGPGAAGLVCGGVCSSRSAAAALPTKK